MFVAILPFTIPTNCSSILEHFFFQLQLIILFGCIMDGDNKFNTPSRSYIVLCAFILVCPSFISQPEGPRRVTKSEIDFDRQSLRRQLEESKRITLPSSKRMGIYQQENLSDCNPRKCDSNEVKDTADSKTLAVVSSQFETIYVCSQCSISSRLTRRRISDST